MASGRVVRAVVAAVVLLPVLVTSAGAAPPGVPPPAVAAPPPSPSQDPKNAISIAVDPAPGVPKLGERAVAHLRATVRPGVLKVGLELSTSGPIAVGRGATATASVTAPGAEVTFDVPFTVTGEGMARLDAVVSEIDAGGVAGKARQAQFWAAAFAEGVFQSPNGPTEVQILHLQYQHEKGALGDDAFRQAVDQALGSNPRSDAPERTAPAEGPRPVTPAAGSVTVSGKVTYRASDNSVHPVRRGVVEIRDSNLVGSELVATVSTKDDGTYSAVVDNSDTFGCCGRDIFVRALSQGDGFVVEPTGAFAGAYRIESPVQPDQPDGAVLVLDLASPLVDATAPDRNGGFAVADAMVTGIDYTKKLRGSRFGDITVRFPDGSGTNFGGTEGHILQNDRYDWDVNLHEYGHYFADQSGIQQNGGPSGHSSLENLATRYTKAEGEPLAWREGYATYFSLTAQHVMGVIALAIPHVGDTDYSDLEEGAGDINYSIESMAGRNSLGEDNEVSVMRTLWDIFDNAADAGDQRGVALGDASVYNTLKAAGAKTLSAGYQAIIAGKAPRQVADIGCIMSEHKVAPKITAPADKSAAKVDMPPTVTWDENGDGPKKSNKFVVQYYDAVFATLLFSSPEQAGNSFGPPALTKPQWKDILDRSGPVVNIVVKGSQTEAPETGPYTSCNIRLVVQKVDLVFAIDTTGSMGSYIGGVKTAASDIVNALSGSSDFRIGLVDYKDLYASCPSDGYAARTDLPFSTDKPSILAAINALGAAGGCDTPESVYSGLMQAIGFPWRNDVKKTIILMGDAPPHDPEPVTGFTAASVIAAANAVDPASIYAVNIGGGGSPYFDNLSSGTGGTSVRVNNPSEAVSAILNAISTVVASPIANAGGPYTGSPGVPVTFDGSRSVSPVGSIVKWEWDFDNNGVFDASSASPTITHTYAAPYDGVVVMRVTDDSVPPLSSIAMATVKVGAVGVATSTAVTSSANPSGAGEPVTFTATVSAPSGTPSGGTVQFSDGATNLGPPVALGAGMAQLTTGALAPGSHAITAAYSGASAFTASTSAPLVQVVDATIPCDHTITGRVGPQVLGPGRWCITGASMEGLTVRPGASVSISNSKIVGPVTSDGATLFRLCGSQISRGLSVSNSRGFVVVGDPGDDGCAKNDVGGPTSFSNNAGGLDFIGNRVLGGVTITGTTGVGPFPSDTAPGVGGNTVVGTLACSGNAPAPTNRREANSASAGKTGQCATL